MHTTLIFFMLEDRILSVPQAQYARFLRGEWRLGEYASRAVNVADWYAEEDRTGGAPRVVNETYSILQLDELGRVDWRRCRVGGTRNHALYEALKSSRYDDPDDDPQVRKLRAQMCDEVAWLPSSEERRRLESAAADALRQTP